MGKYTDQASSYKTGIDMFESSIETVREKIREIGVKIANEDKDDALNYYVESFNEELKSMVDNLVKNASTNAFSLMQKASEIDARIEQEEASENKELIEAGVVIPPKENQGNIGGKMGW